MPDLSLAEERGKGLVIVANKWDLLDAEARKAFIEQVRYEMPAVAYAPIVPLSAKTGRAVGKLVPTIVEAQRERHRRVGTAELNRFFRAATAAHQPSQRGNHRPKLFFVSQPLVRPPTFIVAASHPEAIEASYGRYLQNALRERFGLTQADLARVLRLGANTVSRWESGRNVQTAAMDLLLRLIRDLPGSLEYVRAHSA